MKRRSFAVLSIAIGALACGRDVLIPTASSPPAVRASMTASAQAAKVPICHVTGNGGEILIHVDQSAVPAHLAHGDFLAGIDHPQNCTGVPETCDVAIPELNTGYFITTSGLLSVHLSWNASGTATAVHYAVQAYASPAAHPTWNTVGSIDGTGSGFFTTSVLLVGADYLAPDNGVLVRVVATCAGVRDEIVSPTFRAVRDGL